MAHCTQYKRGNLYDKALPERGPYSANVETVCQDQDSFSRQYSSFSSNIPPPNPEEVTEKLEKNTSEQGSLLGNVANMIRSVLGTNSNGAARIPPKESSRIGQSAASFHLPHQTWPTPYLEAEEPLSATQPVATAAVTPVKGGSRRKMSKKKSQSRKRSQQPLKKSSKPTRKRSQRKQVGNIKS